MSDAPTALLTSPVEAGDARDVAQPRKNSRVLLTVAPAAAGAIALAIALGVGLGWYAAPLTLVAAATGYIAVKDMWTLTIRDRDTLPIVAGVIGLTAAAALLHGDAWPVAGAAISAAFIFAFLFVQAWLFGGVGGGDIKYSPAPAFALGALSPLLALLWLLLALIASLGVGAVRHRRTGSNAIPLGPGMAVAIPLAIGLYPVLEALGFTWAAMGIAAPWIWA